MKIYNIETFKSSILERLEGTSYTDSIAFHCESLWYD